MNLRIVSQVWQWLVTPHPTIIDPRQRRRAELLATLMILLVPLVTLLLILAVVTDHGTLFWQDQLLLLILALLVAGSAIYGLSRTPYYLIGALLAIVLTTLGVFGSMLIIDQFDTQFLLYLIVPILLASFFISLRVATVLFGVFIAVFLLLPVFFPFITYANLLNGPLSTFVIVCAIVLLTRRFRNLLEDERWAAIERSERRYRIVSEMTSDYAYSLNVRPDGAIQTEWITQAFTTITGYTPEEANDWRSLIHPDDLPIAEARRDRLLRGEEDESVLRIVTKTGMVRWLREVGRPVWDDVAGRVVRIDGAATDITAAKEIQNSLELLEKAIHSAGEGVAIMALDALEPEIVFVNDGLLKIIGATRADFVGQPFTVFADMMTDDDVLDRMIRAVRAGQSLHTQTDNYRLDHTLYNLEWHVTPVLNADQGITHFSAILRDVTQRTQAQLAEQDQRALAEALRDIAAGLTSTLDVDEVLDRILTTLSRVVPHDSGNITLIQNGTGVVVRRHTFGQRDQEAAEQYVIRDVPVLAEMLDTGRPYVLADTTLEWLPFPGAEQMQSYVGVPIQADRQVIGFLQLTSRQPQGFTSQHAERLEAFANLASIALRNAQSFKTKQQQAMELEKRVAEHTLELVEEQRRQQAILDSVGEGVFYTESGIILYVNPQLCQQTGYASEELVGQPTTLLQPEDDTSQWGDLATRLAEAPIWRGEVQVRQASGDVFDAGVTIARISEAGAANLQAVTVVRDISQEKALREEKNQFIAVASHELRTPLTNFMTRLYLLRRQPERVDVHVHILDETARQMKTLVENLLDLTRFERGAIKLSLERIRLQDIIEAVVRVQQPEADLKNITLFTDLPAEPLYVQADSARLQQVFANLINNAIKFTPISGQVDITLETSTWRGQPGVCIRVQDTGAGIAPENQARVFEPFYRLDEGIAGTGLGLSISREIVELHGGAITLYSELGQGSCFEVCLAQS